MNLSKGKVSASPRPPHPHPAPGRRVPCGCGAFPPISPDSSRHFSRPLSRVPGASSFAVPYPPWAPRPPPTASHSPDSLGSGGCQDALQQRARQARRCAPPRPCRAPPRRSRHSDERPAHAQRGPAPPRGRPPARLVL